MVVSYIVKVERCIGLIGLSSGIDCSSTDERYIACNMILALFTSSFSVFPSHEWRRNGTESSGEDKTIQIIMRRRHSCHR